MANKENRVIYPGEGVFLNGRQANRAQTLGSTSTLNNEVVNELGNKDIVEIVEDAPSVAITLDTNDHATLINTALIAGKNPDKTRFVTLYDFEGSYVNIIAPVVRGVDYGKTGVDAAAGNLTIYRTQYIEKAYVNSIEFSYTTGGIATENYALEADNKTWLWNDASNVIDARIFMDGSDNVVALTSSEVLVYTGRDSFGNDKIISSALNPEMAQFNDGSYTLGTDAEGVKKIVYVNTATADATTISGFEETEYLYDGTYANGGTASFSASGSNLFQIELDSAENANTGRTNGIAITFQRAAGGTIPAAGGTNPESNNYFRIQYAASQYGQYFIPNNEFVGGLRQGQIQIYLVKSLIDSNGLKKVDWSDYDIFWRVQSVTISASLSREVLSELGHFKPYARSITYPIPVTVSIESTDSDTEMFATLCGKNFSNVPRGTEVSIDDLLKNLNLVVKLFRYTDVQRKKIKTLLQQEGATTNDLAGWVEAESALREQNSSLLAYGGTNLFADKAARDQNGTTYYVHDLAPMKVVSVRELIPTDEGQTLSIGSNATQSFSFTAYNMCVGIGAASPQTLSIPPSGAGYYLLNGSGDSAYDIGYLGLAINTSGADEVMGVQFVENGVAEYWAAFKWGQTLSGDTSDTY
jgi:hypothetical protein